MATKQQHPLLMPTGADQQGTMRADGTFVPQNEMMLAAEIDAAVARPRGPADEAAEAAARRGDPDGPRKAMDLFMKQVAGYYGLHPEQMPETDYAGMGLTQEMGTSDLAKAAGRAMPDGRR